jgi:hypothetical protein
MRNCVSLANTPTYQQMPQHTVIYSVARWQHFANTFPFTNMLARTMLAKIKMLASVCQRVILRKTLCCSVCWRVGVLVRERGKTSDVYHG